MLKDRDGLSLNNDCEGFLLEYRWVAVHEMCESTEIFLIQKRDSDFGLQEYFSQSLFLGDAIHIRSLCCPDRPDMIAARIRSKVTHSSFNSHRLDNFESRSEK